MDLLDLWHCRCFVGFSESSIGVVRTQRFHGPTSLPEILPEMPEATAFPDEELNLTRIAWNILLTVLMSISLLQACDTPTSEARSRRSGALGTVAAPDMQLNCVDGTSSRLSDFRGQVVVLNFWATWCPPCRVEIPHFVELNETYKDQGIVFIGVSFDHETDEDYLKAFMERTGIVYGIAKVGSYAEIEAIDRTWSAVQDIPTVQGFGGDEPVLGNGTVQMMPTTFVIDKEGYIYRKHVGARERKHLEPELIHLLNGGQEVLVESERDS